MDARKMSHRFMFLSLLNFALNCRLPFDWQNPFGYIMAVIIQCVLCFGICREAICPMTFGIATFFMLIAITEDVKGDVFSINMAAHNKSTTENRIRISQQLSEFIQFHWSAKQLSEKLVQNYDMSIFQRENCKFSFRLFDGISVVYHPTVIVLFSWALTTICGSMLMMQWEIVSPMFLCCKT